MVTKQIAAVFLAALLLPMAGCRQEATLQDGSYRAEVAGFDSRGYKDYLEVTVEGGEITEVVYDGVDEDGGLKTKNEKYAEDMQAVQDTYPEKYTKDLINQYLEAQSATKVDALAGATYSSEVFTALASALEAAMLEGNTSTVVVENPPEK